MVTFTATDDSPASTDSHDGGGGDGGDGTLRRAVDWVVAVLLVLVGLVGASLGVLLNGAADRSDIARMVAEGTIHSDALTDAELVDATHAVAWWGGLGLAVTGALLVVAGVGFVLLRRRTRGTDAGLAGDTLNAVVGAVVTVVASFVPFSPVLGGGVAGYLSGDRGARVGALSGVVGALPVVVILGFLAVGLVAAGFAVVAVVALVTLLFAVAFFVALSALGGFVGVAIADRGQSG